MQASSISESRIFRMPSDYFPGKVQPVSGAICAFSRNLLHSPVWPDQACAAPSFAWSLFYASQVPAVVPSCGETPNFRTFWLATDCLRGLPLRAVSLPPPAPAQGTAAGSLLLAAPAGHLAGSTFGR